MKTQGVGRNEYQEDDIDLYQTQHVGRSSPGVYSKKKKVANSSEFEDGKLFTHKRGADNHSFSYGYGAPPDKLEEESKSEGTKRPNSKKKNGPNTPLSQKGYVSKKKSMQGYLNATTYVPVRA